MRSFVMGAIVAGLAVQPAPARPGLAATGPALIEGGGGTPEVVLARDAIDDVQSLVFLQSFGLDAIKPVKVPPGKRVFLTNTLTIAETGSRSTYDGLAKISVRWRQTGGPEVKVENADGRKAVFVAPATAGELTFKVTLKNRAGTREGVLSVTVDPTASR